MNLPFTSPRPKPNYKWSSAIAKKAAKDAGLPPPEPQEIFILSTFWPRLEVGIENEQVENLIADLYPQLGNRSKRATTNAVKSAMFAIACCGHDPNVGFLHPATNTSETSPKRYNTAAFSRPHLAKILKKLEQRGLVRRAKGLLGIGFDKGLVTLWLPTEDGRRRAEQLLDEAQGVVLSEPGELVVLKSSDGKLKGYEDNEFTTAAREQLRHTNEFRLRFIWKCLPTDIEGTREAEAAGVGGEHKPWISTETARVLPPIDLICRRVFKGSLKIGGRFYCPAQRLRKQERATLTIHKGADDRGEQTIEIDFKSHHARMLYHREGIEGPEDGYAIADDPPRSVWKDIGMYVMNCKNRAQAVSALSWKHKYSRGMSELLIDMYCEYHQPVAHRFFQSLWGDLQFDDSQLTADILTAATAEGIPVLPVHDSYITGSSQAQRLMTIMVDCYRRRFNGFTPGIGWPDRSYANKLFAELKGQNGN